MTALLHQHRNHQEELFHAPEANGSPTSGQGVIHECAPCLPVCRGFRSFLSHMPLVRMSMGWVMSHTLKQEYSIIVSSSGSRASFAC